MNWQYTQWRKCMESNGKKLHAVFQMPASELMPNDEASRSILRDRAKLLAQKNIENKQIHNNQYICFTLGGSHECYGIPYSFICGIINDTAPAPLPCVPDYIAGVINQRGNLISIIDLKPLFHTQLTQYNENPEIIIITANNITLGILADGIEGSDFYEPETLTPPFAFPDIIKPELIIGLHRGVTAIINVEALISMPELQINQYIFA